MEVIQQFKDKYVYDTVVETSANPPAIKRTKIQVLREVISTGATESTFIVKYPGGRNALVSKNMYYDTQEAADNARIKDLSFGIEYAKTDIKERERMISSYKQAIEILKGK